MGTVGQGRPRLEGGTAAQQRRRALSRANNAKHKRLKRPVFRAIIEEFLSHPCTDCNHRFPLPAMEADHVRGKKHKISWFRDGNGSEKALRDELAKCEVRCANCHNIRHAKADGRV